MKKTLLYLAGAAALLVGCAKEVSVEEPTQTPGSKTITIQASIDPETRTTVEINNNKGVYSWVANEKIGVIEAPDDQEMLGKVVPFTVSDLENGLFTGTLSDGYTLAGAVSPQSFVEGAAYANGKLQYIITLSGFYNYDNGTNAVMVAGAPTASGDLQKFSFKHAAALIKVTYENVPVGTKGLSITMDQPITGEFDFDSFENVELVSGSAVATAETTAYVEFSSAVTDPNQTFTFYAPIPTGNYSVFSVALVGNGYQPIEGTSKTKQLESPFAVTRGAIVELPTITLEEAPVEKYFVKVTSADAIVDGAQYVIGATFGDGETEAFYAIPAEPTLASGKIEGEVVPVSANKIATSDAKGYVWTLSKEGNYYALSDGSGYLYHSNGGNSGTNLGYGESASYLWNISEGVEESGLFKFASVLNGEVKTRGMLFNGSTTQFGGYALSNYGNSGYAGIDLYMLEDDRVALVTPSNLQVSDMTLSWNEVEGAANYTVTVGSTKATVTSASYTFEGEADYYDVSVVANPSDEENYKSSAPATLEDAKFGTPTLKTPVLNEGVVNETSINVTWTIDPHAEMYTCEIYDGETKVDEDLVDTGSVTFSGLDNGKTYTIKVYADAVTSPLAYAQSGIATIEIATEAKKTISTVLSNGAGTYVISDVAVYAVKNNALILGDETGKVYAYKSSHGLKVNDVVTVSGDAKLYSNGVFEFDSPTFVKTGTTTIDHGTATEISTAGSTLQAAFTAANNIHSAVYVHGIGEQTDNRTIVFGDTEVYLTANESDTNGKVVEVYGYVYAYSTANSNFNFLVTSIEEYVDPNAPALSVSPETTFSAPATWASGEGAAKTFTVTPVNGTWAISSNGVSSWAEVETDGNTIQVTPNSAQASEVHEGTIVVTLTPSYEGYTAQTATIYLKQAKYSQGGGTMTVDFESAAETYVDWEFVTIKTQSTNSGVSAHGGDYYGGTDGKESGSITTKEKVSNPSSLTFYISKESNNTTASSWLIKVSSDGSNWTQVGDAQSASSGITKGQWTEVTRDLSSYSNVYVRIEYNGTTAKRCIDDVSLSYGF